MSLRTFNILLTTQKTHTVFADTLAKYQHSFSCDWLECNVCDDCSINDSVVFVQTYFVKIQCIKNKVFLKLLLNDSISKLSYNWKKLQKSIIKNFNSTVPK